VERHLTRLSITSWNIHRGRGEDGMIDPARTGDVLCEDVLTQPVDLVVLQEADEERPPHHGILDLGGIVARTGLVHVHRDRAARWGAGSHGFLGVILLAARGIEVEDLTLLDLPGHCHRGAVVADIRKDGCPLRLVGMHLSLTQVLRVVQMRTLGQHLFRREPRPTVLCGDLNEWRPWGGLAFSRAVLGARFAGPAPPTFPVRRPILPLDRVLAGGGAHVRGARVLDGARIRIASDHRPVLAEVEVGPP
jgi:endonuclease/exonuclease/phosphatase family metal-dependent hydrolase